MGGENKRVTAAAAAVGTERMGLGFPTLCYVDADSGLKMGRPRE